ncbi:MAG: hypothetical protein AABX65_02370 [Nanoarchaeota archaeon]
MQIHSNIRTDASQSLPAPRHTGKKSRFAHLIVYKITHGKPHFLFWINHKPISIMLPENPEQDIEKILSELADLYGIPSNKILSFQKNENEVSKENAEHLAYMINVSPEVFPQDRYVYWLART